MNARTLVAGIDSSTQSCKVTVRDIVTGKTIRKGKAAHPAATILDPRHWWEALLTAIERADGLDDVSAISVSGQQHTPVFLDAQGAVVCDSPLWNDIGSHTQMVDLNREIGREEWIRRTGMPLTLSDTAAKLRWLRDTNPDAARRTAAVALPHDWLTWLLKGFSPDGGDISQLTTDRSEASGTAYWSGAADEYCSDLVECALGHEPLLPRVLDPLDRAGLTGPRVPGVPVAVPLGVGSGDNAAAALALGLRDGDAVLSLGTSGVVYVQHPTTVHDYAGYVCSYADAKGGFIPLVATLNAARSIDQGAVLLGISVQELDRLALRAPSGSEGLTVLPFFEGERTPDLPNARGSVHGATLANFTPANFARAVIEGAVASQVGMIDALRACSVFPQRLLVIGGASRSPAVRQVITEMVDLPVIVPSDDEYVARGAAMQAAAALSGSFPDWAVTLSTASPAILQPQIMAQRHEAMAALNYV